MLHSQMNPRVFWGATIIIALLLIGAMVAPGAFGPAFGTAQDWVIDSFGWFYVASVSIFLLVALGLAISPAGRLRLGAEHVEPDFPYVSWLAMLFAAGMGIGLMYFAVAEPIQHYIAPPDVEPGTAAAAREAMVITFTHYGVHAWAIYAIVGLSLAYFSHRKGLPLTLRSGLQPLLGKRIDGVAGDAIDVFAICGTVFGLATSLGFGASQMAAGLAYVYKLPNSVITQIAIIAVVMGAATLSVLSGVDRGVRRLSELNLIIAVLLMLFVLIVGPTLFLLRAFVQNIGLYLDHFFIRSLTLYAYEPRAWMADWTLFYWAWWIAWSPFVGMFIARISRGRTIRQFVVGVLLVPAAFTFLWMTVFGNTAIALDLGPAAGGIAKAVHADLSTALFKFLEYLPGRSLTSTLAILLVAVFFITSADSGSLVIGTLASGGAEETPRFQRVFWCILLGATAALLLLAGGLGALQAATLMAALPFCFIMFLLIAGLIRQTQADLEGVALAQQGPAIVDRFKRLFTPAGKAEILRQIAVNGEPALMSVRDTLLSEGWADARVESGEDSITLTVTFAPDRAFVYRLYARSRPLPAFTAVDASEMRRNQTWTVAAQTGSEQRPRDLTDLSAARIIEDVFEQLKDWRPR